MSFSCRAALNSESSPSGGNKCSEVLFLAYQLIFAEADKSGWGFPRLIWLAFQTPELFFVMMFMSSALFP
jgi:hypothetical protein